MTLLSLGLSFLLLSTMWIVWSSTRASKHPVWEIGRIFCTISHEGGNDGSSKDSFSNRGSSSSSRTGADARRSHVCDMRDPSPTTGIMTMRWIRMQGKQGAIVPPPPRGHRTVTPSPERSSQGLLVYNVMSERLERKYSRQEDALSKVRHGIADLSSCKCQCGGYKSPNRTHKGKKDTQKRKEECLYNKVELCNTPKPINQVANMFDPFRSVTDRR
ncbi:hypothetical protein PIB30_016114 [Stylosanthes scabra]|uniref:Uncharacterized protein n=1 Tax=Stylosanthes scabra TaxID=79078 RepID=A0ABU6R7G9_9FABA|nr:hypothetical protein [Stylosanthes scabra]